MYSSSRLPRTASCSGAAGMTSICTDGSSGCFFISPPWAKTDSTSTAWRYLSRAAQAVTDPERGAQAGSRTSWRLIANYPQPRLVTLAYRSRSAARFPDALVDRACCRVSSPHIRKPLRRMKEMGLLSLRKCIHNPPTDEIGLFVTSHPPLYDRLSHVVPANGVAICVGVGVAAELLY